MNILSVQTYLGDGGAHKIKKGLLKVHVWLLQSLRKNIDYEV